MKRNLCFLLAMLMLCAGLSGCSASNKSSASTSPQMTTEAYAADSASAAGAQENGQERVNLPQDNRKIIYEATLTMEALDYDATCKALLEALDTAKGYVSSTDLQDNTWEGSVRSATYTMRIPADQYNAFLKALGTAGNVVSQQETTQDITAEYVDVEARLGSLRLQEERLITMMESAGELETLLAIQTQLTEVQYRIESYTAQQRTYDNLVQYSTVTVYVREVQRITESKHTFGQRIAGAFGDSWHDFGVAMQNFAVGLVYLLPTLLLLAILAAAGYYIIRFVCKKSKPRGQMAQPMQPTYVQPPQNPNP